MKTQKEKYISCMAATADTMWKWSKETQTQREKYARKKV